MDKIKIKFPGQNKPEFIKELRENVKLYFEKNNLSIYGNSSIIYKSVFMTTLYLTPFILMLSGVVQTLPMLFLCWIIMGIGNAGIGMAIMHDANHRTYSKNQKVNSLLSGSLYLLGGYPLIWQHQHNTMHHGFTNIDGQDEDIDPGGFLRFSPHKPLYKIHRFQHYYAWFFYAIMTLSWVTVKEFRQLVKYKKLKVTLNSKHTYGRILTELIISKALYYLVFLVTPFILLPFAWQWILLAFICMHFISGLILTTIFQTAHVVPTSEYPLPDENYSMRNNWAIHQLITTADFAPKSRVFSWLIGGLNFQVVHHLFPNISHVHYRKLSVLVSETAEKYGLPYHVQRNFIIAVISHIRMLKLLGQKPALSVSTKD